MKNYLDKTNYISFGLSFLIIGITMLVGGSFLYTKLVNFLVMLYSLFALTNLFKLILTKNKTIERLLKTTVNISFAIVFAVYPNISIAIIPLLFGLYLLVYAIIKLIAYILLANNNVKEKNYELILAIIYVILSFGLLLEPIKNINFTINVLAIYCILLAISNLFKTLPLPLKQKIRISLPPIIDMFIPLIFFKKINNIINESDDLDINQFHNVKISDKPDLLILIHASLNGFNSVGHTDICIDGTVISYGNYDPNTYKLNEMIGEGIMFETNFKKYIPFCIKESKKTIISFGIKLTKEQKQQICNEIERIKKKTIEWIPTKQLEEAGNKYAYVLQKETKAKLYKFKSSIYKTYFVLHTNCDYFVDKILRKAGSDILKIGGIITPGTYLDYLEQQFNRNNTNVISKTIYTKETIKEFKNI